MRERIRWNVARRRDYPPQLREPHAAYSHNTAKQLGKLIGLIRPRSSAVWKRVTDSDSLRFDIVDQVMLIVHADVPPSASDWARLLVVRDANRAKLRSTLVIAPPRASINAAQRADVVKFMKETGTGVAVLTDSALVRGVAMAVGFLGVKVRAFAPNALTSALTFLTVPESRHANFVRRVEALRAQLASAARLSIPPPKA